MTNIVFALVQEMERTQSDLTDLRSAPVRSRTDIMANILNETRLTPVGSRKTRLMYRCNLSFTQLKIYLKLLVDKGFLRASLTRGGNEKVEVYQITKEGLSFLEVYNDLRDRLGEKRLTP